MEASLNQKKKKFGVLQVVLFIALIIYTVILLTLILWAIGFSLKGRTEYNELNIVYGPKNTLHVGWFAITRNFTFESYQYALSELVVPGGERNYYVLDMYWNSILYSVGTGFFTTLVPCITAYLCSKFKYGFSKIISAIVIITMIIPIVGADASAIRVARTFNLYDSIYGMWVMGAAFCSMYFLVFEGVFSSLPNDYAEAAEIDGASNFTILLKIMLPLVRNTFFTVFLINFMSLWNNYATPMLYLRSHPTIAYGVYYAAFFTAQLPIYQIAISMLVFIPMLVIFAIFNNKLMGNLTMGGLKG